MPRKGFWAEGEKNMMNPSPVTLSPPIEPKNMQKSLWLAIERASGVRYSQVPQTRAQRQALKKNTPGEMSNFGLSNGRPDSGESVNSKCVEKIANANVG